MCWLAVAALMLPLRGLAAAPAATGVGLFDTVQVHGFASQAFTYTSANNFLGDTSDGGAFTPTEIGLNASMRPIPSLQLSGQLLYRRAGESDDGSVRLDYGLLDWSRPLPSGRFGVRAGRVKNPIGLYNETRDVAFTRPSIILPQSIYFDRVRNLEMASDGGQAYLEHALGDGELMVQLGGGLPQLNQSVRSTFISLSANGDLDGSIFYGRALYEQDGGRIRLGIGSTWLKIDYDARPNEAFIGSGDMDLKLWVASAQYNAEKWSLTAEAMWEPIDYRGFEAPFNDFNVAGGYLQGAYRFFPGWEGFLRYDTSFTDFDDRSGDKLAEISGQPNYTFFTRDLATGLRWDINKYMMVRVEYHRIKGTNWVTLEDNVPINDTRKKWDLFSAQLSLRF